MTEPNNNVVFTIFYKKDSRKIEVKRIFPPNENNQFTATYCLENERGLDLVSQAIEEAEPIELQMRSLAPETDYKLASRWYFDVTGISNFPNESEDYYFNIKHAKLTRRFINQAAEIIPGFYGQIGQITKLSSQKLTEVIDNGEILIKDVLTPYDIMAFTADRLQTEYCPIGSQLVFSTSLQNLANPEDAPCYTAQIKVEVPAMNHYTLTLLIANYTEEIYPIEIYNCFPTDLVKWERQRCPNFKVFHSYLIHAMSNPRISELMGQLIEESKLKVN